MSEDPLALLARWIRQEKKEGRSVGPEMHTRDARGRLRAAVLSTSGQQFLESLVTEYKQKARTTRFPGGRDAALVCHRLGVCYELLGRLDDAVAALERAVSEHTSDHSSRALQTDLHRVRIAQACLHARRNTLQLSPPPPSSLMFDIPRRLASQLTVEEFMKDFAMAGRAVVIEGLSVMDPGEDIVRTMVGRIGNTTAPLKEVDSNSLSWAHLEPHTGPPVSIADFITSLQTEDEKVAGLYLHDMSLPIHAASLLPLVKIPSYFEGDLLSQLPKGRSVMYAESWPSLFISGPRVHSPCHVDSFASNFWMHVLCGEKVWTLFPRECLPLLHPLYFPGSLNPSFPFAHPEDADIRQLPGLRLKHFLVVSHAMQIRCRLRPGDTLFVPHSTPHAVRNLKPLNIALSANYVDATNIAEALTALEADGCTDPHAEGARQLLKGIWERRHLQRATLGARKEDAVANTRGQSIGVRQTLRGKKMRRVNTRHAEQWQKWEKRN